MEALIYCFDAFSVREPVSTSLENAIASKTTRRERPTEMASAPDDLRLAADFAPAGYDDWRKLVDGVLKGAPFEKLVGKTHDGQRIDHPDAAQANAQALHDLENGASGLEIEFAGSPGARGFGVADGAKETLARLFAGVFFDAGAAIALNPVLGRDNTGI